MIGLAGWDLCLASPAGYGSDMTGDPTFGAMLARLLEHREVDPLELAGRAGLPEDGVRSVLAGEAPDDELLRQIAPALGFHAVDLFLFSGLAVSDHLAPLDALAERWVPYIVMDAVHLPAAGRRELLQLIRLLPQEERGSAFDPKGLGASRRRSGQPNHPHVQVSQPGLDRFGEDPCSRDAHLPGGVDVRRDQRWAEGVDVPPGDGLRRASGDRRPRLGRADGRRSA